MTSASVAGIGACVDGSPNQRPLARTRLELRHAAQDAHAPLGLRRHAVRPGHARLAHQGMMQGDGAAGSRLCRVLVAWSRRFCVPSGPRSRRI